MNPRISITVATWNRISLLSRVLDALEEQSASRHLYEIIVCDSASTDGTPELVDSLSKSRLHIVYVDVPVNSLSAKRNAAIQAASTPLVVFLDDDVIPDRGFVEAHLRAHSRTQNAIFCGQVRFPPDMVAASNYVRFRDSRHPGPTAAAVDSINLPFYRIVVMNCSFRKTEILGKVGPVSEAFVRYGCEDIEFGYRIEKANIRIVYLPGALAWHHEYNGSLRLYLKKLYIATRDSAETLYALAPGSRNASKQKFLEPPASADLASLRLSKFAVRLCMRPWLFTLVRGILETTDGFSLAYFPVLFRFVSAYASFQGVGDRLHSGVVPPGQFFE
jgi:GT2 family glycosyltransferase